MSTHDLLDVVESGGEYMALCNCGHDGNVMLTSEGAELDHHAHAINMNRKGSN